jgi:hypothetical protein
VSQTIIARLRRSILIGLSFALIFQSGIGGFTAPTASAEDAPDSAVPSIPVNGQPNAQPLPTKNEFDFTWDASIDPNEDAITYEYQTSQNSIHNQQNELISPDIWKKDGLTENKIHSTGAGDGQWYWQVRAIDSQGHKSAWSDIWVATIDSTAPKDVHITSPAPGESPWNNEITIAGTATDASATTVTVGIRVLNDDASCGDLVDSKVITVTNNQWTTQYDTTKLANGRYCLRAMATDAAGNSNQPEDTVVSPIVIANVITVPPSDDTTLQPALPPIETVPLAPLFFPDSIPTQSVTSNYSSTIGTPDVQVVDPASSDQASVLGVTDTKKSVFAAAPRQAVEVSDHGWQIYTVAWYWWFIIAVLVGGSWWAIATIQRNRHQIAAQPSIF